MINKVFLCIALSNLYNTHMRMLPASLQTACSQAEHLIQSSEKNDISPFILASLIWHESRWEHTAVSNKNACGLTQILPKYSDYSCNQLKVPEISIQEGASVLSYWKSRTKNLSKALACYNSGYKCSSISYAKIILAKSNILKKEYFKQIEKLTEENNE